MVNSSAYQHNRSLEPLSVPGYGIEFFIMANGNKCPRNASWHFSASDIMREKTLDIYSVRMNIV